jgi:hypothetical protein
VTPDGHISFVSHVKGGATHDKTHWNESGAPSQLSGSLVDWMGVKSHLVVLGEVCAILGCVTLQILRQYPATSPLIFVFGAFFRAMNGILSVGYLTIFANAFGHIDITTISAVAVFSGTVSVSLGSFLFALSCDQLGSFDSMLWLNIAGAFLWGLLSLATLLLPLLREN